MYNLKYNTEKTLNAVQTTLKLMGSDSIWYVHVTLPFGDTFDTFEVGFFFSSVGKTQQIAIVTFYDPRTVTLFVHSGVAPPVISTLMASKCPNHAAQRTGRMPYYQTH